MNTGVSRLRSRLIGVLLALWAGTYPLRSLAIDTAPLNGQGTAGPPQQATLASETVKEALLAVQSRFYHAGGMADYKAMKTSPEWKHYRAEAARLRTVNLRELTEPEAKTAFWLNIYNAMVADGILALHVRGSVLKQPDFFRRVQYNIGGALFSLDAIEHGILRGNRPALGGKVFKPNDPRLAYSLQTLDPRIHFALNCGARSCPPIRLYEPKHLNAQLDMAARNFIQGPNVQVDITNHTVRLSPLFQWYAKDFGQEPDDILRYVATYLQDGPEKTFLLHESKKISLRYLPYDWSLNGTH